MGAIIIKILNLYNILLNYTSSTSDVGKPSHSNLYVFFPLLANILNLITIYNVTTGQTVIIVRELKNSENASIEKYSDSSRVRKQSVTMKHLLRLNAVRKQCAK